MAETSFTFRVDSELKSQFNRVVRERDRKGAQVLRDFMRRFIETDPAHHEDWLRAQVLDALNDGRAPLTSAAIERQFAGKRRRAAAKSKTRTRAR